MRKIIVVFLCIAYSATSFAQDFVVPSQNRQQEVEQYWTDAKIAYKEGRKEDAAKLAEKIIDISPFFNAYQALGEIYKELEDIDKIADIIDKHKAFIQSNPNSPEISKRQKELSQLEEYYVQLKKKRDFIDLLQGVWVSTAKTKKYSSPNWVFEISKKYNHGDVVPYKFQVDKRCPNIQEHLSFVKNDSICFVRNIQMREDGLIKMVFTSRRLQVPPVLLVETGMKVTEEAHNQMTSYIIFNEFSPIKESAYLAGTTLVRNLILLGLQQQQAKNKVSVIEVELKPQEKGKLTGTITEMQLVGLHTGQIDTIMNVKYPVELLRMPEDGVSAMFCETPVDLVTISSGMLSRKSLNESGYTKALNSYKNRKFAKNWGGALLTIGGAALGTIFIVDDNTVPACICYGAAAGGIVLWSSNFQRKPIKKYNEQIYENLNGYYSGKKQKISLGFSLKSNIQYTGPSLTINF